jgi:hypothetical protein
MTEFIQRAKKLIEVVSQTILAILIILVIAFSMYNLPNWLIPMQNYIIYFFLFFITLIGLSKLIQLINWLFIEPIKIARKSKRGISND